SPVFAIVCLLVVIYNQEKPLFPEGPVQDLAYISQGLIHSTISLTMTGSSLNFVF
ncbi:19984_t:CDS:1, partial [Funneliformis geosporum]